ncbi:excinuclease ABC subunit UvrC [Schumannella sp. 10F1B-5-1]|uniref:excinuclease ABC subunit UvrC n=1 Tax=Schumannella sp. 10F1B-5-1 TaxID=2590780 RepID=UPI001131CB33|nr:excinuclease ABC subunit UvrC [Schumannella sp. 10F1B-5-1]TPW70986.1 excinuclease ABC subunit UvrC [Schumannella sp. 10F1B-5-1]
MARPERADAIPWRPKPSEIPTQPGVYRFRSPSGRVIYVGKAKNLRQRLANYFQPLRSLHDRTRAMVLTAASVEWTVVGSDFESLQLEYTWIKEFDPPFNVKFRDDKSYPYLAVTMADEAPRVMVTRNRRIPGARYFGPYPKIWAVRETIELMVKAFPIRTCSDSSYKRAMQTGRPCFPGQIGRCGGPCSHKVTIEEHRRVVEQFVAFMASHDRSIIGRLQRDMKDAAGMQDYEEAAKLRDRIQALENVLEKSAVVLADGVDADVFGIEHDELAAAVQQFVVRGGRVRGVRSWVVDKELDVPLGELVDGVLETAYEREEPPREIIVPEVPDDVEALQLWLGERRGGRQVVIRTAQRGDKRQVLETATMNAKQALALYKTRRTGDYVARTQALEDIRDALGLAEAPLRIECYDVSHLGGTGIVASMVVFEDGLPRKNQYRKFSVPEYADDTAALYQVLSRRLAHLDDDPEPGSPGERGTTIELRDEADDDVDGFDDDVDARLGGDPDEAESDLDGAAPSAEQIADRVAAETATGPRKRFAYRPGLLIVDGGQPQVEAAARALRDAGADDIPLAGLAKRLEEIWLPGSDYPVILPRNSEALFLLQRVRDEAHRFAITFQRQKRKGGIQTELSGIPGLGPTRVTALLKHFGSVTRLRAADADAIGEVKGIGPALAATIAARLGTRGTADAVPATADHDSSPGEP